MLGFRGLVAVDQIYLADLNSSVKNLPVASGGRRGAGLPWVNAPGGTLSVTGNPKTRPNAAAPLRTRDLIGCF